MKFKLGSKGHESRNGSGTVKRQWDQGNRSQGGWQSLKSKLQKVSGQPDWAMVVLVGKDEVGDDCGKK